MGIEIIKFISKGRREEKLFYFPTFWISPAPSKDYSVDLSVTLTEYYPLEFVFKALASVYITFLIRHEFSTHTFF